MSQKGSGKGTGKELRIVTKKVVTEDIVKKDIRKLRLMKIIDLFTQISERGLTKLLYMIKGEKGVDVGYEFIMIGDTPSSRDLADDLRILLYLGLIETDPISRRLRLTSKGKEFLELTQVSDSELEEIIKACEDLRPKIEAEESATQLMLGARRRRRRRRF